MAFALRGEGPNNSFKPKTNRYAIVFGSIQALGGMKLLHILLLTIPSLAFAGEGVIPEREISLGGVAIGETPSAVASRLGQPMRKVEASDFLNLHYYYPHVTVSFSDGVVAGLFSDKPDGCTPKHLCPGDRLDKMRSLYGAPLAADRETGRFYEYYPPDATCWLQIPAKGEEVVSITVACQP
ncbi:MULTISPECIES: hypothetical protein [unclassified Lysobacter]|uniref:hypothetical protein n=1 Tax=unclassified Lysobacter TaxID=2635362 RepID=UPI0012DCAFED|nr:MULTISPECIES: hypothetical protein [unclassified Lysobacter]